MNRIFNNWLVRYIVIFSFIAGLLYGFSYFVYPTPYYYTHYSNDSYHYFVKINRKTGEVYRFSTNSMSGRQWELLNK